MHPILEIALGVALGMTIFLVVVWVLGMTVYVCCNKNECIASCNKSAKFKANLEGKTELVEPVVTEETAPVVETTEPVIEPVPETEPLKESETS